jgi:predicted phage-related endonuclease
MIPTTIVPRDREEWLALRSPNLNSTEVGSLFGILKYASIFELWHYKNKSIQCDFTGNERTEWGLALQDSIAAKVAKDNGWTIRRMDEYMYLPEIRLGSSFDFSIESPLFPAPESIEQYEKDCINNLGILEIKNVDKFVFLDEWTKRDDGSYDAPLHIEIQVQTQLAVSGRKFVWLVALVGGNEAILIKRERDEAVIKAIIEKVKWFWQTIAEGKEPEPDFKKDAEFIAKLYGYAEPEKVLTAGDDIAQLAAEYKKVGEEIKPLEEKKEELKARLLVAIADAEKVVGDGFSISAGMVGEAEIKYTRKPYRLFKVNWKKEKK